MKKIIYITIMIAICNVVAKAQMSHTLYTLESVPQSTIFNPARQPRCNFYFAIPATNIYIQESTNIRPLEFFKKVNGDWITPIDSKFSYSKINKLYKKKMALDINSTVSLFDVGWRTTKEGYITVAINERIDANVTLPSDIVKMVDKGVPNNTLINLARLGINAKAYHEISASYTFNYDDRWSFGARVKYLSGIGAVKTKNKKFDIDASRDLWRIKTNIEVMTSLPLETDKAMKDDGTIVFDSIEFRDLENKDIKKLLMPGFKNPGFGFDLGATYRLDENFRFGASVTDLGCIFWGNDIHTIKSNSEFDYDGVYVNMEKINNDEAEYRDFLEDELDTLNMKMMPTLNHKKFATGLNPNIYISGEYTPNHYLTLSFLSHTKFYRKRVNQDFNISASVNPYKPFSAALGLTLNTQGRTSTNVGLSVRGGIVQFYTMVDYVPFKYNKYHIEGTSFTAPSNISNINVTVGLNIVLGPHGYRDNPMINTYSNF